MTGAPDTRVRPWSLGRPPVRSFPLPLILPGALAVGLAAYTALPGVRTVSGLFWSFVVASAGVLFWTLGLCAACLRNPDRALTLEIASRKPHWIQMLAQGSVILWWGWFVRPVYEYAPFILAQLILAVAVDSLFSWTRRGRYTLGFGTVPVVFSLNLFLWFHLPWFFLQLAMVVLVYVGKEFVRRRVDGRSRHIFNPSAFALSLAALALIATGQTGITQGVEIAQSQYVPPYIFLVIFLAAVPGQLLFGVATMTMPAVLVIYGFSAAYLALTGAFFFYDAHIPIAVFLGLHLLFTDPATSPRSELGRVIFGVLYGTGVIVSVVGLNAIGAPPFYDKLLPVPILNLLAPSLDRVAQSTAAALRIGWAASRAAVPAPRRVLTVGLWAATFGGLSLTGGLGDDHPGQYYPFWRDACDRGNERACDYTGVMQWKFCDRGSGWACNEFGIFLAEEDADFRGAAGEFGRACRLGFAPGCTNLETLGGGPPAGGGGRPFFFARSSPPVHEMPIVIRGSKGPVGERDPAALIALACERGWGDWGCREAGPP